MAVSACGGTVDDAEDDELELGELGSAIHSGTLAQAGELSPVVKITATGDLCSAVRIGTRRFLTAAHCLSPNTTSLDMRTSASGAVGGPVTVTKLVIHPSFALRGGFSEPGHFWYDVALFDIAETTSANLVAALPAPNPVPVGASGLLVGYGEDALNAVALGHRQKGSLTVSTSNFLDSNVHNFNTLGVAGNNVASGKGDSGGAFFASATDLTVRGLDSFGPTTYDPQNPGNNRSGFVRLGNILDWINDPQPEGSAALIADQSALKFFNPKQSGSSAPLGLCMSARGRGGNTDVILDDCDNPNGDITRNAPGWRLSAVSGGFNIISRFTGQCLSVANPTVSPPANDTALVLAPCDGANPTQRWALLGGTQQNPARSIRNVNGSRCIGTQGGSVIGGTSVRLENCIGGLFSEQAWLWTR